MTSFTLGFRLFFDLLQINLERREMQDRRGRQDAGVGDGVGEVKKDAGGREFKTCHRVAAKVRFFYI